MTAVLALLLLVEPVWTDRCPCFGTVEVNRAGVWRVEATVEYLHEGLDGELWAPTVEESRYVHPASIEDFEVLIHTEGWPARTLVTVTDPSGRATSWSCDCGPSLVFSDNFETGDVSRWDQTIGGPS